MGWSKIISDLISELNRFATTNGDQPTSVTYCLGISTPKSLTSSLPTAIYINGQSFGHAFSALSTNETLTLCKNDADPKNDNITHYFYEMVLDHCKKILYYNTKVQSNDYAQALYKEIPEKIASLQSSHETMPCVEYQMFTRAWQFIEQQKEYNTVTHIIDILAANTNPIIVDPSMVKVDTFTRIERKIYLLVHLVNVKDWVQSSDEQVWHSKMCIIRKKTQRFSKPADNPEERLIDPMGYEKEPDTSTSEKVLSIEYYFQRCNHEQWRRYVDRHPREILYYELLYNPETVLTYAVNYMYLVRNLQAREIFETLFAHEIAQPHLYVQPQSCEWLVACCDVVNSADAPREFGWTPDMMDDISDKFNVTTRVAFDNTAAWPKNCTNPSVASDVQGHHPETHTKSFHVLTTEEHQQIAFLGCNRKQQFTPTPATYVTEACGRLIDRLYGHFATGVGNVPMSKDQAGKFFNRGTDMSNLTKTKELLFVTVPVIMDVETLKYTWVLLRVRADDVMGKLVFVADNIHNKTLSASYLTSIGKAISALHTPGNARAQLEALEQMFRTCYQHCVSLDKTFVPVSYGQVMDTVVTQSEQIEDHMRTYLAFLYGHFSLAIDPPCVFDEVHGKPQHLGPTRRHDNQPPVLWDMLVYHTSTSQIYDVYNSNVVSDKMQHTKRYKRSHCGEPIVSDGVTISPSLSRESERVPSVTTLLLSQTNVYFWARSANKSESGKANKVLGTMSLLPVFFLQMPLKCESMANLYTVDFVRASGVRTTCYCYGQTYFSTRTPTHEVGDMRYMAPNHCGEDGVPIVSLDMCEKYNAFNYVLYNIRNPTSSNITFAQFSTSDNQQCESIVRNLKSKRKCESIRLPKSTNTNSPTTFFCFLNYTRDEYVTFCKAHNGYSDLVVQCLLGIKNLTKKWKKDVKGELRKVLHDTYHWRGVTLDDLTGSDKLMKMVIWGMYNTLPEFKRHVDNSALFSSVTLFHKNTKQTHNTAQLHARINTLTDTVTWQANIIEELKNRLKDVF